MSIIPLTTADLWLIIWAAKALGRESPVYSKVLPDDTRTKIILMQMFTNGNTFGFMSDDCKGVIFGCTSDAWYDPTLNAYEQMLYVDPGYRGGTMAGKLIRAFENGARERGAKNVFVGSSAGINDVGVSALYKRLGYVAGGASLHKEL